jgi:hypothetical protein
MAMQRSQNELGVRQLTALQIDKAPMIALKMIEKLIQDEHPNPAGMPGHAAHPSESV